MDNNITERSDILRPESTYQTAPLTANSPAKIQIRVIRPADVDPITHAAWAELEHRALQANAFLSPHFVLPSARYLDPDLRIHILLAERISRSERRLIGVGIFNNHAPNRRIPFPHLLAYRSTHSFASGLLVDKDDAETALNAFFDFFSRPSAKWLGFGFHEINASCRLFELLADVAEERKLKWFEIDRAERPVLVPANAGQHYIDRDLSSRQKNLKRSLNKLQKLGNTAWRVTNREHSFQKSIDRFVELEHMGWKGHQQDSLRARTGHEDFFCTMATNFLRNDQAFFTELTLDDEVISSTFNLISGNVGFAFKIGWNPAYEKMSPGLLNEIELIRQAPDYWPHLSHIDSCAPPGSYMEDIWTERQTMVSGAFATTATARTLLSAREYLRNRKKKILQLFAGIHGIIIYTDNILFQKYFDIATTSLGIC